MKAFQGFVLLFLLISCNGFSQKNLSHNAFQPGEKIEYKAYYNWGFIWIHAGNVLFRVKEGEYNNQETFQFDAFGKSLKSYDWMFKVRDHFRSYVNKNSFNPYLFRRDTYEGGYEVQNEYLFHHDNQKVYTQVNNSREPYKEDTLQLPKGTLDILTAIYYSRNLDFSKYQHDDKIPLSLIIDNEIYDIYIRYLGMETIEIPKDREYDCIKFSAMLVEGTIFNRGEHLTVWVTNDRNRIPVMVKAKILVGSVKAILKSTSNLKYPSILSEEY